MRRVIGVALAGALLLGAALPGEVSAWGGPRIGVFVGAGPFWWAPGFVAQPWPYFPRAYVYPPGVYYLGPYYSGPYYPPAYSYPPSVYVPPAYVPPAYVPPAIVQQTPRAYVQQNAGAAPAPPRYWYFCQDAEAYYPYVRECARGWTKVVPSSGGTVGAASQSGAEQD
jgi:hypothetical protein